MTREMICASRCLAEGGMTGSAYSVYSPKLVHIRFVIGLYSLACGSDYTDVGHCQCIVDSVE